MNATTLKRWLWIGTAVLAVLWTLLTWGAYALIAFAGDALSGGAGFLSAWPDAQYWLSWSVRLAEQFGVVFLVIAWAIGLFLLLVAAWVGARFGTRFLTNLRDSLDAR